MLAQRWAIYRHYILLDKTLDAQPSIPMYLIGCMKELRFECGEVTVIAMLWGREFEVGDWGYICRRLDWGLRQSYRWRYLVLSTHIVSDIITCLPWSRCCKVFNIVQSVAVLTPLTIPQARSVNQHNSTILILVTRTNTTSLRLPSFQAWSTAQFCDPYPNTLY